MAAVTIVTGFLGAGKTTRVNSWLADYPRGDVAVIVNEVGAIGIDGELLAGRARTIVEITGGCVCCVTHGELVRALQSITDAKRILVETSGAASPAAVIRAMRDADVLLDGIVTVVDATRLDELRDIDLAQEQIGYADVLVLSHADEAPEATLTNGVAVVTREHESLEQLLARRTGELPPPPPASSHAIETLALTLDGEVDEDRFAAFMEEEVARFSGRLFRIKGIVSVAGLEPRMLVQGVADHVDVTFLPNGPRTSRLVLVGFGLDAEPLRTAFARVSA